MIIGLTGFARVGKDEVAKILVEEFGFTQLSFAASLKQAIFNLNPIVQDNRRVQDIVEQFGWDVAKDSFPEIRKLLQRMGTEVARELWSDTFWIDIVDDQVWKLGDVVISDARFLNEAQYVQDAGGYVIRVHRPGVGPINAHASDAGLPDDLVDFEIHNDGTLDDLKFKVINLINNL